MTNDEYLFAKESSFLQKEILGGKVMSFEFKRVTATFPAVTGGEQHQKVSAQFAAHIRPTSTRRQLW